MYAPEVLAKIARWTTWVPLDEQVGVNIGIVRQIIDELAGQSDKGYSSAAHDFTCLAKRASGMTLRAVAKEEGVTQERVRQREQRALNRMRRHPLAARMFLRPIPIPP